MTKPVHADRWNVDPRSWMEDVGLPARSRIRVRDLPAALTTAFPDQGLAIAHTLTRTRIEIARGIHAARWWAVIGSLPPIGFVLGWLGKALWVSVAASSTRGEEAFVFGIAFFGAVVAGVASWLFLRWVLSRSRRWDRYVVYAAVAGVVLLGFLEALTELQLEVIWLALVIASVILVLVAPGLILSQMIWYLLARYRLRRRAPQNYILALLCGLFTRASAQRNSPRDAAYQRSMLWGLEELAEAVGDHTAYRLPAGDARTHARKVERGFRRAEAIRYWKDDVLEPEQDMHPAILEQLRLTLLPVLSGNWGSFPEAISVEVAPGWRDWLGTVVTVVGAVVIYFGFQDYLAELSGEVVGSGELLGHIRSILPFVVLAWAFIATPRSVKQSLATHLAGLKELKELR